jgi:hypothetical protein
MTGDPDLHGFDLAAAGLRSDETDAAGLVDVLAAKLEGALPHRCTVERRRRGLLSRQAHVGRVAVELGNRRFLISRHHRRIDAVIETEVHDMRRRTEQVDLGAWLQALRMELERQAEKSAEARAALEQLLES